MEISLLLIVATLFSFHELLLRITLLTKSVKYSDVVHIF